MGGRYDYDAATDGLVDQDGVEWTRVPDGEVPGASGQSTSAPTSPPATDAPAPAFPAFAADPAYTCDLLAGTYGGSFGDIRVTATTPTTWHGLDDNFHAEDEGCGGGGGVRIEITVVSEVYPDICRWRGTGVDVQTPEAESAAFSESTQFDVVGPTDTEVGGFPARQYELTLPAGFDQSISCSSGVVQFWRDAARDEGSGPWVLEPGAITVYFVEVGDVTLGVYAFKGEDWATPAMRDELDAVVASLRIEP
jgi:hypothetical protein